MSDGVQAARQVISYMAKTATIRCLLAVATTPFWATPDETRSTAAMATI